MKTTASSKSIFIAVKPFLLLFLLPYLITPTSVQALDFFYTTGNGQITFTRYTGTNSVFSIPAEVDNLPVTGIGGSAFSSCATLTSVNIPSSVTWIGDGAFSQCTRLSSTSIPNSVMSLGDYVFYNCTNLTSVTLPNNITTLGNSLFQGCTRLPTVTIPESVTNMSQHVFSGCTSLSSITIPNHLVNIGVLAFYSCSNLNSLVIGNSVTQIGDWAFQYCTSLSTCSLPACVKSIGPYAFSGCTSLTSMALPDSVISIYGYTFENCTSMTGVTVGTNVNSLSASVFYGCKNLTAILVDSLNPYFSSVDGVVFNKNMDSIIIYPAGKSGDFYTIPDSVAYIGDLAFGFSRLASVTLPSSINNIGPGAFSYCTSLKGIYFMGNAPTSGSSDVFSGSDFVTIYYLPGTVRWGSSFRGRPTAPWQPRTHTGDGCFGAGTNGFGFNFSWACGQTVVVETSTNLVTWRPVQTNTLTSGSAYFCDPQSTNCSGRYYRLRSP